MYPVSEAYKTAIRARTRTDRVTGTLTLTDGTVLPLTAAELIDHEDALIEAQTSGNARMASELSVQIVIDSLVQPDGSPIKAKDKPTAKELLAAHDNVVLLDAIDKVKKHAIGKLETAEKN